MGCGEFKQFRIGPTKLSVGADVYFDTIQSIDLAGTREACVTLTVLSDNGGTFTAFQLVSGPENDTAFFDDVPSGAPSTLVEGPHQIYISQYSRFLNFKYSASSAGPTVVIDVVPKC
ncbi:hypothetical protein L6R50_13140 [Myxococcota bacterium]|nr:hypothetical protein [Myxococcota bacterium]